MTDPGPVPLLFGFRGIRMLQLIVAAAATAIAIGGVIMVNSYINERSPLLLLLAVVFGLLFIWLFSMAVRLPTSFVAVSAERIRIRFGGFTDQTFETRQVVGAELRDWPLWRGLGVRASFGDAVALVAASGTAAELHLRQPIRVWVIPRVWRVSATRVVLSVRNPKKMVDRFGAPPATPSRTTPAPRKARRKGAAR